MNIVHAREEVNFTLLENFGHKFVALPNAALAAMKMVYHYTFAIFKGGTYFLFGDKGEEYNRLWFESKRDMVALFGYIYTLFNTEGGVTLVSSAVDGIFEGTFPPTIREYWRWSETMQKNYKNTFNTFGIHSNDTPPKFIPFGVFLQNHKELADIIYLSDLGGSHIKDSIWPYALKSKEELSALSEDTLATLNERQKRFIAKRLALR